MNSESKNLAEIVIQNHNWNTEFFEQYHKLSKHRSFGVENKELLIEAIDFCIYSESLKI